jgi:hypothetical protein
MLIQFKNDSEASKKLTQSKYYEPDFVACSEPIDSFSPK